VTDARSINIAILAMGGEGGGVLADWLLRAAEETGFLAQSTSVPGVAQRTGSTIYYLELFPRSAEARDGNLPVLALMPMAGDVDLVVASELMEAGRAIQRGFVTPGRTLLVASTHRVYSMTEKTALGDGRIDADAIIGACREASLGFVAFDMASIAERNRSVISAVLLGAIAGSRALPFPRESFERAIEASGVSVSQSLTAFSEGFRCAGEDREEPSAPKLLAGVNGEFDRLLASLPEGGRAVAKAGAERTLDYQDAAYAIEYLNQLVSFGPIFTTIGERSGSLLSEVARQLALGMTYEDTIRVAELKIRRSRFARVRDEVAARADEIVEIVEFMHPRIDEVADTMPAALGRFVLSNSLARRVVSKLTSRGRMVRTTSLRGFLLLYGLASMKQLRRRTLRYARERQFLSSWLATVRQAAAADPALGTEFAKLRNLVKGYGETYERGLTKYRAIHDAMIPRIGAVEAASELAALLAAAEQDEEGIALSAALGKLSNSAAARGAEQLAAAW
jgi:indolepyruvate ferredoxin oxidoreductase, beta subunit